MLTDTSYRRNPHYHQLTDTPDTLDYPRMAQVVEGVCSGLKEVAKALGSVSGSTGDLYGVSGAVATLSGMLMDSFDLLDQPRDGEDAAAVIGD